MLNSQKKARDSVFPDLFLYIVYFQQKILIIFTLYFVSSGDSASPTLPYMKYQ